MFTTRPGVVHRRSCSGCRTPLAWAPQASSTRLPPSHRQPREPRDEIMREEFQADLNEVSRLLVTMAESVRAAMRKATTALLKADREAADAVVARDAEVDEIYRQVEAKVADTIARQAPVASDLRMVI